MLKKISVIGILTCILYFISVGLFLITKADVALTIWELMTVISGPLVLLVMIGLAEFLSSPAICRNGCGFGLIVLCIQILKKK